MRRFRSLIWLAALAILAASARLALTPGHAETAAGTCRVAVRDVLRTDDMICLEVTIEADEPAFATDAPEGAPPDQGSGTDLGSPAAPGDRTRRATFQIAADRISVKNHDVFKISVRGASGTSHFRRTYSHEMPVGKGLADVFKIEIQPGTYRLGEPLPFYQQLSQAHQLTVRPTATHPAL